MKTLFFVLLASFIPSTLLASTWCQWDGSEGVNCKSTSRSYINIGHNVSVSAENLNPRGWYERIDVQPTIGENQVRDEEQWSFADNQITRSWTVRDLTAEEIDQRTAVAMSLNDWRQWSALQQISGATNQQMANFMGPELTAAWLARNRLENP